MVMETGCAAGSWLMKHHGQFCGAGSHGGVQDAHLAWMRCKVSLDCDHESGINASEDFLALSSGV